ncbi:MAG TPA: hypothetical protein VMA77_23445 [Solirubrobacteraceae bacterium]|nr:hypothetical protein [Solirubrobacteraceae bacterium]HUA48213.1 hypothetical protein [Solirubrobacteraceae bacterium]
MPLTSNTEGQMYALTVLAPIAPGEVDALEQTLANLPHDPSPLSGLGLAHFARWVIIPDFGKDPSRPQAEHFGPYLLFSATFDGDLEPFLEQLCVTVADDAEPIWSRCIGVPIPARGAPLKAYLRRNQVQTGLFFAAYPQATVEEVTVALALRKQTIDFAIRSQGMDAATLRQTFLDEF